MKEKLLIGFLILGILCSTFTGCGVKELPAVKGLEYADGILSFESVDGADAYELKIVRNNEAVYNDKITVTSVDIEAFGLEGRLEATVTAVAENAVGTPARIEFTVLSVFDEVVFEAEDYLYNFGTGKQNSNFRNNSLASKGAYVGGIDDAGQGIYINYFCPFDGEYEFDAYYLCGEGEAQHDVWVNGEYQTKFSYTEETGWGGDSFTPAKASTQIVLRKGWNTISIMKNGTAENNWGGFAELDYLVLKGNGEEYNADELGAGNSVPFYRLEAEMGSPRKKNPISFVTMCSNPCIAEDGTYEYSNGFLMGGLESTYDGVEWQFNSPEKARYKVVLAYASGEFEGSSLAKPTIIVTQEEVPLFRSSDFVDVEQTVFSELPYTGWNNVTVAEESVEITLEAGKNFIYCLKMNGSGFFQLDYIDLIYLGAEE